MRKSRVETSPAAKAALSSPRMVGTAAESSTSSTFCFAAVDSPFMLYLRAILRPQNSGLPRRCVCDSVIWAAAVDGARSGRRARARAERLREREHLLVHFVVEP